MGDRRSAFTLLWGDKIKQEVLGPYIPVEMQDEAATSNSLSSV